MADFGKAGKLTIRTNKNAVTVTLGQKLRYSVTVEGAVPIFAFACEHKARAAAEDFPGHPKQLYSWVWRCPEDVDADDDTYTVEMSFVTATKYTLLVEHLSAQGEVMAKLKDLDAASSDPGDKYPAALEVMSA